MMINVVKIPWEDILHAVPAFLTIVLMPLTYSIAYGMSLNCAPLVIPHMLQACWGGEVEGGGMAKGALTPSLFIFERRSEL